MSAKRLQFHQGASSDVQNAVAWYRQRSAKAALDFIEELHRATETICASPDRWPIRKEPHETIPVVAIPVCRHLFRARIAGYDLGRRPWEQTT